MIHYAGVDMDFYLPRMIVNSAQSLKVLDLQRWNGPEVFVDFWTSSRIRT